MRPPEFLLLVLNAFGAIGAWNGWRLMLPKASGRLHRKGATSIPENEAPKVVRVTRAWVAIHAVTILAAAAFQSWMPLLLVGLPRLYGAGRHIMMGLLQRGGLADNVVDRRLNSRTAYMDPVSRFIYLTMNQHVEHHMFPRAPFYDLPRLHALIRQDLPVPSGSIPEAFREMWSALRPRLRHEGQFLRRELPALAGPYREDFHLEALGEKVVAAE